MNPSELTMLISSIAVFISNEVTDDNELALWALYITRLGNTLTSISAQRVLTKKIKSTQSSDAKAASGKSDIEGGSSPTDKCDAVDASTQADRPNNASFTSYKAPTGNPQ